MAKTRIFVICPVRRPQTRFLKRIFQKISNLLLVSIDQWVETQNTIKAYVEKLEVGGYEVYWPARDNPFQKTDKTGMFICQHNRERNPPGQVEARKGPRRPTEHPRETVGTEKPKPGPQSYQNPKPPILHGQGWPCNQMRPLTGTIR